MTLPAAALIARTYTALGALSPTLTTLLPVSVHAEPAQMPATTWPVEAMPLSETVLPEILQLFAVKIAYTLQLEAAPLL